MSDAAAALPAASAPISPPAPQARTAWHNASGFSFRDILDIINPLQHLPIIGSVYRWLTGDRPGAVAQVAGDALYGGPIGAAVGFVGTALEDNSGRDVGERVLTAMFGSHDNPSGTAVAAAAPSAAPASAATAVASATPAPANPPASPLPLPARPDHAPLPLFGGIAQPVPAAQAGVPTAASTLTPAQQFLAQTTGAIRPAAPVAVAPARQASAPPTKIVPLSLPAGALPANTATTVPMPVNPQTPVDISQKMLDALDKYQRLEKQRESSGSPGQPAPQGVDLAL
ncbi:MAG TPA: hypothetical protein VLV85_19435 [Stellaceae bacterium]|nr:hypothetical protein [Stellaceae bacterium]